MSMFSLVQGRVPPVPQPEPRMMAPQQQPMQQGPLPVPAIPGFKDGGVFSGIVNTFNNLNSMFGGGGQQQGQYNDPRYPLVSGAFGIEPEYWDGISEADKDALYADARRLNKLDDPNPYGSSGGGGGGYDPAQDAVAYAKLAQDAKQWQEEMAFTRKKAEQDNIVAQETMKLQAALEQQNLENERRKQGLEAASQAQSFFTDNVGYATVPGISNWAPITGTGAATKMPSNPMLVNPGQATASLARGGSTTPQVYQPNIPSVTY